MRKKNPEKCERSTMKYIILLYTAMAVLFLGGLGHGIVGSFGLNPFVWGLIAGVLLSIFYLQLYLRALSKFRGKINNARVFGYYSEVVTHSIIMVLMQALAVVGFAGFIITESYPDRLIPLALGLVALICLILHIRGLRRHGFLAMYFSSAGVHLISFSGKNFTLRWNECTHIGIGWSRAVQPEPNIYFSKGLITDKQAKKIQAVKSGDRFARIKFNDEVLADVLKYVEQSKIKNLQEVSNTL